MTLPCPACDVEVSAAPTCARCRASLVVFGDWRLAGVLGKGGVGRVYLARRGAERAAVKLVRLDGIDPRARALLERSATLLSGLKHPCLARVDRYERDGDRLVFLREAFDGGTLAERVQSGRRPPLYALALDLLDLLAYLHERGVIHRDVKPSNIMFRADDWRPVLVDFDFLTGDDRTGATLVGTPGYAAPEQLAGAATPASDLYALGATLLYAAHGVEPRDVPRDDDGRLEVDLADVQPKLAEVIRRLLEPERRRRYQSARDARAVLAPAEEARRGRAVLRPPPMPSTRQLVTRVAVMVALLLVPGVAALIHQTGGGAEPCSLSTDPPAELYRIEADGRRTLLGTTPVAAPPRVFRDAPLEVRRSGHAPAEVPSPVDGGRCRDLSLRLR